MAGATLAAASLIAQAPQQEPTTQDPAEPIFTATCSKCHTPERILAVRRTRTDWENYDTLMDYLLRRNGKVNINRGDSKEIALIVNLSAADADTIVKYRTDHGDFADYDALAKVPGIDLKKLEQHRDAISY
jgi:competence ComEA-like helix-hairpin-helix protein